MVKMAITYLNVNNGEPESCENFIKEQIKKIPAFFFKYTAKSFFQHIDFKTQKI